MSKDSNKVRVLDLLYRGYTNAEVSRMTNLGNSYISLIRKRSKVPRHTFVPSAENERWIKKNIPEDVTISDFLNAIVTDARFSDQEDA